MTTRGESLVLLDYLRHFDGLGELCREDGGGEFPHNPEACAEEVAEYLAWERMLRVSGPVAELAYFHIRSTAKIWWREHHGQDWNTGVAARAESALAFDPDLTAAAILKLEQPHGIGLRPPVEGPGVWDRERIYHLFGDPDNPGGYGRPPFLG